jgi:hypothetical protein
MYLTFVEEIFSEKKFIMTKKIFLSFIIAVTFSANSTTQVDKIQNFINNPFKR